MTEIDASAAHPRPAEPGGLAERLRSLTQARPADGGPDPAEQWQSTIAERLASLETSTTELRPALDQVAALVEQTASSQGGQAERASASLLEGIADLLTRAEIQTRRSEEILAAVAEAGAMFPAVADAVGTVSDQVSEVNAAITSTRVLVEAGLLDLGAAVATLGRQLAESEEQRKADRERFRRDLDDALVLAVEVLLTGGRLERVRDETAS